MSICKNHYESLTDLCQCKSKEIANLLKAKYPEIEVTMNEIIIKAATFEAENPLVINV